jgi:hypothetical protein
MAICTLAEIEAGNSERNLKKGCRNKEFTLYTYYCRMRVLITEDRPRLGQTIVAEGEAQLLHTV